MKIEILAIRNEEDGSEVIAAAMISEKELMDYLDSDNITIYFTEEEQQTIMSKPADQRLDFAKNLAETKHNG